MKLLNSPYCILVLWIMTSPTFSEELQDTPSEENFYCQEYQAYIEEMMFIDIFEQGYMEKMLFIDAFKQERIEKMILIDIFQQRLHLCLEGKRAKSYPISTAKNGIGSEENSGKTPLGLHKIVHKIGEGAEKMTIFKGRVDMGKKAVLNSPNTSDAVTTRIMWLQGLELFVNQGVGVDSYNRYIYIHGTAEEYLIGQPASHGCVRMKNDDVIDLFDRIEEGTIVYIVEKLNKN